MAGKKKAMPDSGTIAANRRAKHDYFIDERIEAGICLQGWEVKAMRAGRANLSDSYVTIKKGEMFLFGSQVQPMDVACSYVVCDPMRTRKLLMHEREIAKLIGLVQRAGTTLIPLSLYWKGRHIKCELGVCRGKKEYDKRESIKQNDWAREKARIMKHSHR